MDESDEPLPDVSKVTCDDCFFRRAELCALAATEPCPTFRPAKPRADVPPRPALLQPADQRERVPA